MLPKIAFQILGTSKLHLGIQDPGSRKFSSPVLTLNLTSHRVYFVSTEIVFSSKYIKLFLNCCVIFLFSSKKQTFFAKSRLFKEKEDLICVVFSKRSAKQTQVC